ncbi:6-N-hydroxylaminopurine resistance protein [Raoultella planticola]|uniref:6-N-hydroxylaminopurine resistance protein n=1 Tax=Raoultella planticola TaxID=575 RepID=A0A485BEW0_RAOPL|nr:6-N-hydroxylaminopurine resistance protein [Raoultella planticola]
MSLWAKVKDYDGSRPSAIGKIQVDGELTLGELGLEGDEQAEKKIHGGPDRALCHYPREHYAHWALELPQQADLFCAPAFGENLSTEGLTENDVCIGDIFRWGEALIQVTQPRSPCFKLNYHFAVSDMAQLMQNSGKTGWLYRVVAGGPGIRRCAAGAGFPTQRRERPWRRAPLPGICRSMTNNTIACSRRRGCRRAGAVPCRNGV